MGLFKRTIDVVRSNLNELIGNAEDPAKLAELSISDAKELYIKIKKESVDVVQNAVRTEKQYKEAVAEADKWHETARKALAAGNEEDAKAALARENKAREKANSLFETYTAAKQASDQVQDALQKLQAKISDMENKADVIKAKAATAKVRQKAASIDLSATNEVTGTFDRMEEKADKALARAEAMEQVNKAESAEADADKDLLSKYSTGDAGTKASLEALKAEMGME